MASYTNHDDCYAGRDETDQLDAAYEEWSAGLDANAADLIPFPLNPVSADEVQAAQLLAGLRRLAEDVFKATDVPF